MSSPRALLAKVRLDGFRSIKTASLSLGRINVLIGPNGAGKSNLVTALRLPRIMLAQGLRRFVGEQGGASRLLHHGPSSTREMRFALEFSEGAQSKCYEAILRHAAGDSFVFDAERVFLGTLTDDEPPGLELATAPGGHAESELAKITVPTMSSYASLWPLIEGIGFFHFHDTSSTAPLRQNSAPAENISLRSDGSNLATILYRLKHSEHPDFQAAWKRIEGLIQRVAPFIKSLAPSPVAPEMPKSALQLYWQDTRGHRFEASDLSDGTLRAIALITALAQPATMLPSFIAIDEPELGLHPAALSLIASLARSVSHYSQILLSTQSPALLDEFEPDQVIVAEQHEGMRRSSESGLARVALGKASTFKRLDATELEGWLAVHALEALGAMPS